MKKEKKEKKKKKRKIVLVFISIIICLIVALIVFLLPKIKLSKDLENLNKEAILVNNYLNNKVELEEVKEFLSEDITTSKKKLEKEIDKYANLIIENDVLISTLKDEKIVKALSLDNIKNVDYNDELKEYFEKIKNNLQVSLNNCDDIEVKVNEEDIDTYQMIIKKIDFDSYQKKIKNFISDIDIISESLNILKNKDNYELDEVITFKKREIYKEYQALQEKIMNDFKFDNLKYQLVDDNTGPNIEASDLNLLKGTSDFRFKCVDDVDGEVECEIIGEYDVNKVGTYNLEIKARDEAGNESSKKITLTVKEQVVYKNPYYIEIVRNHNVVIVYGLDGNNEYTRIVKTFICSVGLNNWTPTGTFTTSKGYEWGTLNGGLYGQYSTRIRGSILFHSVPYYSMDKNQIEWEEFNKLGEPASQGCIRMTVEDVKWIYDHCSSGVTVKIYDGNLPNGVTKPTAPKIDGTSPNRGWDPTDPDPNNPWKKS